MALLKRPPAGPAQIVSDHTIMSGAPMVRGARVQAETLVACLGAGQTNVEIFEDYPTLPIDGIDAALRWAEKTIGPNWKSSPERNDQGH